MSMLYAAYGVALVVLVLSVVMAIANWLYLASISSHIASLEHQVEKKAQEFDAIRRDYMGTPAAQHEDPSAPEERGGDARESIQVVRNVGGVFESAEKVEIEPRGPAAHGNSHGNVAEATRSQRDMPGVVPEDGLASVDRGVHPAGTEGTDPSIAVVAAAQLQRDRSAESYALRTAARGETEVRQMPVGHTIVQVEYGRGSGADMGPPQESSEADEILSRDPAAMSRARLLGLLPDQSLKLSTGDDRARAEDEGSFTLSLFSKASNDADFVRIWRALAGIISGTPRPSVVLDFSGVQFLYDKELEYLEKMHDLLSNQQGSLHFINCDGELTTLLHARQKLSSLLSTSA